MDSSTLSVATSLTPHAIHGHHLLPTQTHAHTHVHPLPQIALKLLDCEFPDDNIRDYAIKVLRQLPDEKLEDFLLQLTQVSTARALTVVHAEC